MPIFNSKQAIAITRSFASFFTHKIYPQPVTHFLDNGNLMLVYRTDQHKNVTEIIPVDYARLEIKTNS